MSLKIKKELAEVAKVVCRDLRKNSTNAEKLLWQNVRDRKFEGRKFLRQNPFFHDVTGKETFFVADFYCHKEKLIIELDGKYHKYRLKKDEKRTEILNYLGVRVMRFKNEDVIKDLGNVLKKVKSSFEEV
jgi:very-short-patch-repair endonuclease